MNGTSMHVSNKIQYEDNWLLTKTENKIAIFNSAIITGIVGNHNKALIIHQYEKAIWAESNKKQFHDINFEAK